MSRPRVNEQGEVELKSVELLSRDDLALWVKERLHREDWIIPGGAQASEMPHYLLALLYPRLERLTREDLQNIIVEFLEDLAQNPLSEWLGEPGHELIMLTDPVLIQSPRREDAIDLLLSIAGSDHLKSGAWPNLHFRALQGLITLRHRANTDFWRRQSLSHDPRYAPAILEGLALVDVAAPFTWLREIAWNDAVEDGIVSLLPSLLENYGTAKVVTSIEDALPGLPQRGVSSLLTFCEEEEITISRFRESEREDAADLAHSLSGSGWHDLGPSSVGKRLRKRRQVEKAAVISARPPTNYFPLSFSQQRMWFLDQLEGGSSFYNIPAALRLNGLLNVPILERSFNEIIRRHETLRTTFRPQEGEPMQVIADEGSLSFRVLDLTGQSRIEQEKVLDGVAHEDAQRPFDLSLGPLLCLTLLRFDETEHILLITMHHIISDEWSIGLFIREMAALYQAFTAGKPSPLPELAIQYADFSIWHREWLSGERLEKQLEYWRERLGGVPALLKLPTDRPRPAVQTFNGAEHHLMLPEALITNLIQFSRGEGVTLFMTLLAAFQTLLYRYSGQDDIIVGTPVSNRLRSEVEPLIGCFVNTLALRTDMSGDPTVVELLARVREGCLGAYAHQDLPFEKIVEELQPERSLRHTPLFQVMFLLEYGPTEALELAGLSITPIRMIGNGAKFDLTLIIGETAHGFRCVFEYNTDLFDQTTVERIANHFNHLLSAIVAQPHSRISSLSLLTTAERHQLLVEWNDTTAYAPTYNSIAQWFAEQAKRTPEAVALEYEDQRVSYRELNERANQLAHRLLRIGVGVEMLVGVCLERSIEQMVAILGVLKAGAAYVPLDPSYPQARLDYILHDIQATVVLAADHSLQTLNNSDAQTICLDKEWPPISDESIENPLNDANATADCSAYVIYTSGSTGRPKGVLVSHRNLIHSTAARIDYYKEPVTSFLLLSSLAFDSSIAGIFWTLCTGGTLVLPSMHYWQRPQLLAEPIASHKVSHILTLPSLYDLILEEADISQLNSLRTVILAGEACPTEVINRHSALIPQVPIFNEYGPTEATVWSSVYACIDARPAAASVPIGRPISNTQIYLLDQQLNPVPIGVPGELHIGGRGLSRGYLQHPGVTAEKFISNPFSAEPGARLYKTGDLAHYLPDGNIQFVGRLDYQVKVRGFRIEPGEIEAVLRRHESVREVIVVSREDQQGDKRLVAYVVSNEEEAVSFVPGLRSYLVEKMPNYMIPSTFVTLEALPLTANGKVDRRALPAPDDARSKRDSTFISPRNSVEAVLAEIWAEVLRVEPRVIGVNDNFFELGGHSLLAVQLVSRIRQALLVELPLRVLFERSTISELAAAIAGDSLEGEEVFQLSRLEKISEEWEI